MHHLQVPFGMPDRELLEGFEGRRGGPGHRERVP